jgi:hypothetical protein
VSPKQTCIDGYWPSKNVETRTHFPSYDDEREKKEMKKEKEAKIVTERRWVEFYKWGPRRSRSIHLLKQ